MGRRSSRVERSRAAKPPGEEAPARRPSASRGRLLAGAAAVLAVFAVKAVVLARFHDHPLLQPSGDLDPGVYARLAAQVAGGDVLLRGEGPEPFFVSPLYVYFLALIHALSGGSLLAARLAQIALGTAAVGLLCGAVRRLSTERAAWAAGAFLLLTGTITFHEILILQASLDPFLTSLALFLLARALTADAEGSPRPALPFAAAGAAFGLLSLNRPNALLVAGALASLLPLTCGFRRGLVRAAALAAGLVVTVAPATLRNLAVSGEAVLISSHGGLNLYIGNNATADGTYHHVEGITPTIQGQQRDARKVAEGSEGRPLTTSEVSRHFARLAFRWMREHPADALRLFARKLAFTLNADEITLDYSYAYYSRHERSLLPFLFVGAGLLVPLGLVGLALASWRSRHVLLPWALFAPAYAVSVALFFVSARYRLPLLLPLAAGAGIFVDGVLTWLRERRYRSTALAAAALAPPFAVAALNFNLDDGVDLEETQVILYKIDQGDDAGARRGLEALAGRHRRPSVLHYRVGLGLQHKGRHEEAAGAFRQSIRLEPGRKEVELSLAASLEKLALEHALAGRTADAVRELEESVALDPAGASARQNLAALYAEAGRFAEARALATEALRLNPGYPQAEALLKALDTAPR